jgi:hypothetical protein
VIPERFDAILIRLVEQKPYTMFTVELNGGKRFEVDHPRALIVRDGNAVFLELGGRPIWFDHENVDQIDGVRE